MSAELRQVERAAAKAAVARDALAKAILVASAEGHTLREIARAAGISYETVRRMK